MRNRWIAGSTAVVIDDGIIADGTLIATGIAKERRKVAQALVVMVVVVRNIIHSLTQPVLSYIMEWNVQEVLDLFRVSCCVVIGLSERWGFPFIFGPDPSLHIRSFSHNILLVPQLASHKSPCIYICANLPRLAVADFRYIYIYIYIYIYLPSYPYAVLCKDGGNRKTEMMTGLLWQHVEWGYLTNQFLDYRLGDDILLQPWEGKTEAEAKISSVNIKPLCAISSFFLCSTSHPPRIYSSAMAPSKLIFLGFMFLALILTPSVKAAAAAAATMDGLDTAAGGESGFSDFSALKIQVDHLKSKITSLESIVDEKSLDLKRKDELIVEKQKLLKDNLEKVAALQDEVSSLQKTEKSYAADQVGKAHARAGELEKQIEKLQQNLKSQEREKETLHSRVNKAEKNIQELNSKLEKLEQINNEQKSSIRKTERALKIAEEEMMKAKFDATSKAKELSEVHGAWLPPWLVSHLLHFQSLVEKHWNEHGEPAMKVIVQKTMEKKSQAEKWSEPHIETIKTRWVPAVKKQWVVLTTCIEPYVKLVHAKSIDYYKASRTAMTPHAIKLQQLVDPYYQDAKRLSKPYIDQVATTAKPHVDKVRVALKPYTAHMVYVYSEFLKSATSYHNQVQASVQETLKKYEITRALATKELEWFAASALLALPIIMLFRICSGIFCKKTKRPSRHSHAAHHGRRKGHKRGHSDK